MKSYLYMLAALLMCAFSAKAADVVTSTPSPLQQESKNVVVYFHADQGNKGCAGLSASTGLYAHTGVITDKSKNDSDWKYAPTWGDNSEKYQLQYVSEDLWKLEIGDIATYYGVPEGENVTKLAFVFRTADSKKEGKDAGNTDIMLPVFAPGFNITLTDNMTGELLTASKTTVTFTISSTEQADLSLSVNGNVVGSASMNTSLVTEYTFPAEGNYAIEAKGVLNGLERTVTKTVCYAGTSTEAPYPGAKIQQGPGRNADGSVTFCLAAPKKKTAMLMGSWNDFDASNDLVMNYVDEGDNRFFWITVPGLDADKVYTYYYLVDNYYKVGDPYAKLVLDPYNDKYISEDIFPDMPQIPEKVGNVMLAVYHENINKYDWQVKDFKGVPKQDLIIYELLLRDFTGTEGKANGNGTVRMAMEKIPYLKAMGVNAIELLPINEFDGNLSWGYNPNFYFAPDKAYGTPDDYKEFIDLCHQNGIAVILDMVFNQSAGLHPWYVLYGNAANSPFYNRSAPHDFSVLNDWSQDHPLVEQQWLDCVKYWMEEYKVDGYRFDLVKGLGDNDSYSAGTQAYNKSRVERMTRIHAAMSEINPDAYFINENLAGNQEENEMAADGQLNWANVNNNSCQYAMGYNSSSILTRFDASKDSRTWGSTVSYAESHDEERMGYKQITWGVAQVKASNAVRKARIACVGAQMILQPGAHMIWQFSELGNEQSTKDANGGNNTGNKTVLWNDLNDPDTYGCYLSWCDFGYLRNEYADLFAQDANFKANVTGWNNGRTITASKGDREIVVVLNPNTDPSTTLTVENVGFLLDDTSAYKLASKTYNTDPVLDAAAKTVTLPANSYAIYVRSNMSGVDEITPSGDVKVYTQNGDIVITGSYTQAEAFTLSGARAPMTGLNTGIYMVRVDGKPFKVIVK